MEKIRQQILAVRDTGKTNMFDVGMVQRIANDMGFYEYFYMTPCHAELGSASGVF